MIQFQNHRPPRKPILTLSASILAISFYQFIQFFMGIHHLEPFSPQKKEIDPTASPPTCSIRPGAERPAAKSHPKVAAKWMFIPQYIVCVCNMDKFQYFTNLNSGHLGMISLINHDSRARSQWGRYNLPNIYIYQYICIYIYTSR